MTVRSLADTAGIASSAVCAAHCLVGPVLLSIGPALPSVGLDGESFHRALLFIVLPSGLIAFALGCWRHRDFHTLGLGALGLAGLVLSATWLHELGGDRVERITTLGAASALILAHLRNYRLCRSMHCEH